MQPKRRALLAALVASPLAGVATPGVLDQAQCLEDFDALWKAIDRGYAYFGTDRADWRRAREPWRSRAAAARSRPALAAALEGALQRLREDHLWMSEHAPGSPRRVPSETDIWASWHNDAAVIESVRTYGDADVAGIRPGHVVRSIAGLPAGLAVHDWVGGADMDDAAARDWGLRHALAGPREGVLRLEVAEARGPRGYEIERRSHPASHGPALIARRVGERRDMGYVRFKVPLSDPELAARFDGAMQYLEGTRAVILDLRDATGPFDAPARARATTLAILQRFAARAGPWQVRVARDGERHIDSIAAPGRNPARLVVLVDRWTAGEGEALAAGLMAVANARLVGTRMAGLRGEMREVRLPHSGIAVRFPAQKALLPDGTPREALQPSVLVNLAAPDGGPGDPILYQGLQLGQ